MFIKRLMFMIVFGVCLQAPMSQAANVDGDPGVDLNSDTGLYVWRDSSGRWQLQMVSASTQTQEFSGTFTSSQSITQVTKDTLENHDSVSLTSSNTLTMAFTSYQGGLDGIGFTTAQNANLCLRDSSGAQRSVYLGANRVAATTPVDLTGTGACGNTAATSTGEGLQITRLASQDWQVRQVSTNGSYQFKGTFEATQNFSSYQPVSLENGDSAGYSGQDVLNVALTTWPGGSDGVNFSISGSAGICLRESGNSGIPVYLNNARVSLPLDLTGSGACSDSTTSTSGGTTSGGTVSTAAGSNYGHYLGLMPAWDTQTAMVKSYSAGMQGFLKRYTWAELEPTQGNYNFSEIRSDLDFLASQGQHLIVMLVNKSFKGYPNESPLPPYLQNSQYQRPNRQNGYTAIIWNSYLKNRFKALLTALGNRFDGHVAFEGVLPGSESAPSLDDAKLDATAYTPEKYRDALIDMLTTAAKAAPNSRVFWLMNFLPRGQSYIADVAEAVSSVGVVMGGPDVLPDNSTLVNLTYPYYTQFKNKMDLFAQVETECYWHEHKNTSYPTEYWTMPEEFRYARDNLHVKYMFWNRYPRKSYGYGYEDALPVIANNPVFNQ